MSTNPHKMPSYQGVVVLNEARRRVAEEHGPRPETLSMCAPRPSFGSLTAGFFVSPKMVEQARERGGMEAGRAWDKLVVAECRRIAHEVAAGNFIIPERNVTCL